MRIGRTCLGSVMYLGGVPAVLEDFCHSWGQMIAFSCEGLGHDEYIHFSRTKASLHDVARNFLANQMLGGWLLMLDTDHSFEPDLVLRMVDRLEICKIDVLTGLYQYKIPPYLPVLYQADGAFYRPIASWRAEDETSLVKDIFPIDGCGGGCLLIRRSVFSRIKEELREEPFDRKFPLGEDLSFCKRCELLGIKIYCDARIECHHLQIRQTSLSDYDRDGIVMSEEKAVAGFVLKGN